MSEPLVHTLSAYFREHYGRRVHKIALDGAFTCPNRDGSKGEGGCAFCDSRGSMAPYRPDGASIEEQVRIGIRWLTLRFKADRFIAYFQGFSGTYDEPDRLRELYDAATRDERVIGLSVATRSDCLGDDALDVVASYVDRLDEVRLEFGLQTMSRDVLEAMGCGHSPDGFRLAVERSHARGIKTCGHVIFGLPGDEVENVLRCADLIGDLGVEGVKIHNLYLTADSRLGGKYLEEPFAMMTREEYLDAVAEFIARLPVGVVVERVSGDSPGKAPIAPEWSLEKRTQWQEVEAAMERRGVSQGSARRA